MEHSQSQRILKAMDGSSTPPWVDLHTHLNLVAPEARESWWDDLRRREILTLSAAMDGLHPALTSVGDPPGIVSTPGVHPAQARSFVNRFGSSMESELKRVLGEADIVGEIGLDRLWVEDRGGDEAQMAVFRLQLEHAAELGKTVVIHTKAAEGAVLGELRRLDFGRVLIHWYSGPRELVREFLDLGCSFSIGPDVLTDNDLVECLPAERVFMETDGPVGIPWVIGEEARADDVLLVYRGTARRTGRSPDWWRKRCGENLREFLE